MTKRLVGLFGVAVLVLSACTSGTPTQAPGGSQGPGASSGASQGTGEGTLAKDRFCISICPTPIRPPWIRLPQQDSVSIAVLDATQRGLLYYDKDLKLVPSLAEALPEVSADGKTFTFKLRAGAKYADGKPIVGG